MTKELIGNIADVQTGPFGSQLHKEDYVEEGTPIVTVEHLGQRKMTRQNLPCVKDEDKERLNKYQLKTGDLVFSRVGSVDRCSYVSEEENEWLFSGRCLRVRCNEKVYPKYLYYYFNLETVKQYIRNIAVGATMPSINTKLLSEVPVEYPEYEKQKKIADILSIIDDKIELNNKLNANLVELASNLHKQWFLDFGYENFDGKMEQSEVGEIPLGWEVKELGMLMENFDRKRKPLSSRQRQVRKGDIPYYGATSIMDYVDDFIFDDIYVLMGEDGSVMKEDGTPFLQYIWGKSWINNHAHVLKGKVFSTEILYLYLLKMNVASIVTGAVQLKISQGNMNSLKIVCAPREIYQRFDEIIQPIFTKIRNIQEQNKRLTTLRDTILPLLMSGSIDLSEINLEL